MGQPVRRFVRICWFFTFLFAVATCISGVCAYLANSHGEPVDSALLFTCLASFFALIFSLVSYSLDRRLVNRATQEPILTNAPVTPSIRHLLQSLDVQHRMLEQCFERAPFGVLMVHDCQNIVYANSQFIDMTGRTSAELHAFGPADLRNLFGEEDDPSFFLQALERREDQAAELSLLLRQHGDILLPVHLTAYPLLEQDGLENGHLLFVQDISPARQLRLLQQEYAFLFDSINHGIVLVDCDFQITFANEAFCQMFDYRQEQILGATFEKFLQEPVGSADTLTRRLAGRAIETGENQTAKFDLPLPDGTFRHIQITITPLQDNYQQNIGILLHYQDRTTEQELIDTMRRNDQLETVSQMAASIAHEVRNPMTSVQGFLQLMSKEIDPAHAHSMYLHVMEEDLKRINSIITEYLSFSRMGSDSLEDVWIGTLLHNTYTLLQSEANLKGIQLVLSLAGNNPLLMANSNRLKQVLINLARNAMEAMSEQGDGVLTLALDTEDDMVCIMVKDTGPGINDRDLARIFTPFYTTKKDGTGLGLYICKKIIDEHNGLITVTTEAGQGTTFRITLPKNRLFES
jgi:PAS domain S-box-containing protein